MHRAWFHRKFRPNDVRRLMAATCALMSVLVIMSGSPAWAGERLHAIAMHGTPAYPDGFPYFNYVNPNAPKGGTIRFGATGSFDSLNPFIVNGTAAIGLREHVFESLMARGYDEPFTLYGLLARSVEWPADRSYITFHIDPRARFSDGSPVTADDVAFSLKMLRDKGRPNYGTYYSKVRKIEKPDRLTIRFIFDGSGDREIPLIMGLMPILPKHVYEKRDFKKSSLEKPVGSGPYTVESAEPGRRIVYRRNPDYWGKDLPVNRGQHNIDRLVYEYYRDANASFEAFKSGLYDVRVEDDPGRWTTGYDFPAIREGKARQQTFETGMPSGMRALVFNMRRKVFADRRVRLALIELFNFPWINKNLYHGVYLRTQSYFDNSELGSHDRAATEREKQLLAPYPDAVAPGIMAHGWSAPKGDSKGLNRDGRMRAVKLLRAAGYDIRDGGMVDSRTGQPLSFEILVATPADERLALVYRNMVRQVGISAAVRYVDSSQYQQRRDEYDFDMIFNDWFASLSPGNEQLFYWGSQAADQPGTRNYMGMKSPAADAMIHAMLESKTDTDFVAASRALDRVIMSQACLIPLFHRNDQWLAFWNKVRVPETISLYGFRPDTWWIDPQRAQQ